MSELPEIGLDEAYTLTSQEARDLADLWGIRKDLEFVGEVCDQLAGLMERSTPERPVNVGLLRALWTAALIAYARCFATGKRLDLSEKDVAALPDPGALALHEFAIAMRNKHLAHSVNPFETTTIAAMVAEVAPGQDEVIAIGVAVTDSSTPSFDTVVRVGRQADQLLPHIDDRIELVRPAVLAAAKAESLEAVRSRPRMSFPAVEHADASRARVTDG